MSVPAVPNLRCYIWSPDGQRRNYAMFMSYAGASAQSTISQNFGRQGDTATIILVDDFSAQVPGWNNTPGDPHFAIHPLSKIVIEDLGCAQTPSQGVLFAGLVTNPQWRRMSPNLVEWSLNCVDFAYYADKGVSQGKYVGMHAHEIIVDITNSADCGIVANTRANGGFVWPGPIIPILNLTEDKLTSHWDSITKMASQAAVYGWFVDYNRNLWWYPTELSFPSGVTVTDRPSNTAPGLWQCPIDQSQQMFYEWDCTEFYTRVLVQGATQTHTFNLPKAKKSSRKRRTKTTTVPSPPTQTWVANGAQSSWSLDFTPDVSQANAVASATSIKKEQSSFYLTVGGVAKEVQVYDGTTAITSPFQIIQAPNGAWSLQVTSAGNIPSQGTTLNFWYRYTTQVIAGANNVPQEHRIGGPNGGKFSEVIIDSSITTTAAAYARAKAELNEFGAPNERFDFYTSPSWLGFMRVGESFVLDSQFIPNSKFNFKQGQKGDNFFVIQQMISFSKGGYRSTHVVAVRIS